MKKRITSMLLIAIILMTSIDVTAFAAELKEIQSTVSENDINSGNNEDGSAESLEEKDIYELDNTDSEEITVEEYENETMIVVDDSDELGKVTLSGNEIVEVDLLSDELINGNDIVLLSNESISGTFGNSNGFSWIYDESTYTLTITGEDSGMPQIYNKLPVAVRSSVKEVEFKDCVVSGGTLSYMFSGCSSLESIDLGGLDTSKVTSMKGMFSQCRSLLAIDLSGLKTSNVTDMSEMFKECNSLTNVDLRGLDTSMVTSMDSMFWNCSSLLYLDFRGLNTSNVTSMGYMFYGCHCLGSIDLSGFNTSKVTRMGMMFAGCRSLGSIDLSSFNTSRVTGMGYMFSGCRSLTSIDLSGFKTSKVTSMNNMFDGCSSLTSIDISGLDTSKILTTKFMFLNCSSLTSINLNGIDISEVDSMAYMFSGCSSLKNINLSGLDTSYVTSMEFMFSGCSSLESIDLSGVDISVSSMESMFERCNNLTSIDLSGLKTSRLTNMRSMFLGCSSLESIDLSGLNTSNVTDMRSMFSECSSLESIHLSGLDISNVTNSSDMFLGCSSLKNISTFDVMKEGHSIKLPFEFLDSIENSVTEITLEHCNKILTKAKYTIIYNLNGGENSVNNPVNYDKKTETIYLENPTRTGYTFAGWYNDSDFNTLVTEITTGSTGDKTLYAKWTANKYNIEFNGNESTSGSMTSLKDCEYENNYTIPVNEFERTGYTFVGWNTEADGSGTAYVENAIVANLASANSDTVTLYAQWESIIYTITYNLDGGENSADNPENYNITTETIRLGNATRTGYTFVGWYSDSDFKTLVTEIPKGSTDNKTLYAKWVSLEKNKEGDLTSIAVELVKGYSYIFTGKAIQPEVRVYDNHKLLTPGTDYKISYKNNTKAFAMTDELTASQLKNAPQVIVTGLGSYESSQTIVHYFTIEQRDLAEAVATYKNSIKVKAKDALQKASVSLKYNGKTLSSNEYKILYYKTYNPDTKELLDEQSGITTVGTYYLLVEAVKNTDDEYTGNYQGFQILAVQVVPSGAVSTATISYNKSVNAVVEPLTKEQVLQKVIKNLKIDGKTYLTTEAGIDTFLNAFEVESTTLAEDGTTIVLEKLLETAGTKTLQIRGKEEAETGYVGSQTITVSVKGTALKKEMFAFSYGPTELKAVTSAVYTGEVQIPALVVKNGDNLIEEQDYRVSYMKNKVAIDRQQICNAGSYIMVVEGIGRYSGKIQFTFTITPVKLVDAYKQGMLQICPQEEPVLQNLSGAKCEYVVIYDPDGTDTGRNAMTLKEGVDYSITFKDNKAVTTATKKAKTTITGKGNYSGSLIYQNAPQLQFEILPKQLDSEDITVLVKSVTKNKSGVVTKVGVEVYDNGTKMATSNYQISFVQSQDKIEVTVTVKGNNYQKGTSVIVKLDSLSVADTKKVKVASISNHYYTGSQIKPTPVLTANGIPLEEGVHYTVTYGENTKIGKGSIVISGIPENGYIGERKLSFTILAKWLQWLFR